MTTTSLSNTQRKDKRTAEQRAFYNAKTRCTNTANKSYRFYGAKGVQFRFATVEDLIKAVGLRPSPEHSLDRYPDNLGHYEKGNVRWATKAEQSRNTRQNRFIEYKGERLTVGEWGRKLQIPRSRITERIDTGWCVDCAMTLPKAFNGAGETCPHRNKPEKIGRQKLSREQAARAVRMIEKGDSVRSVAAIYGVCADTVRRLHLRGVYCAENLTLE
jgi:hypothetical protein